ncbi:MAG: hypothetical protein V1837_00730 [Candidatus Woesearchaeota archaeon]
MFKGTLSTNSNGVCSRYGSEFSFLSAKDVARLQIPMHDKVVFGEVDFAGSRYKQVELPKFTLQVPTEDKKSHFAIPLDLTALKTTKMSEKKKQAAMTMPSILGMDFLKSHKVGLHVFAAEDLAYLEFSG